MPIAKSSTPASVARSVLSATGRHVHTNRAGDPRAAETAITVRVLREVLLVVVLGEVEFRRRHDLRGDLPVPRLRQPRLELVPSTLGFLQLLLGVVVDSRAVLRADVAPLAH